MEGTVRPLVISLCDLTGNAVRPWADAGYECICYDLQHPLRSPLVDGNISFRNADVRAMTPQDWGRAPAFIFAFPPCTDLSVSGARDFKRKGMRKLIDALELVESCRVLCEWTGCPYLIENPVSTLSTYWRTPDYKFDPCDYGDPFTKKTCLWTGGGFIMPPTNRVEPVEGSLIIRMAPSAERKNLRSATPMGFARAVFKANGKPVVTLEEVA